jgi:hypothetical protein
MMTPSLDPVDAERALAAVDEQRRRVADTARPPWWIWLLTFAVLVGLGVSQDLGASAQDLVGLAVPAGLIAWMGLSRLSPAIAERTGLSPRPRYQALMSGRRYTVIIAVLLGAGVAILAAGDHMASWLTRAGAPTWPVHHPHTVTGVAVAVLLTGLAWLTDQALRARPGAASR